MAKSKANFRINALKILAWFAILLILFMTVTQASATARQAGTDQMAPSVFEESALNVPLEYSTIQAAIDAASPGDTVVVQSGTYYENLTIDKSITLTAESFDPDDPTQNTTIIDGGISSPLATIEIPAGISPMPTIRGFVIKNGNSGINIRSEIAIEHNYFIAGGDQLDYEAGSGGINRYNVYFASGDDGVDLDNMNHSLVIENNRFMYNGDDGIEIRLQDDSAPPEPITISIQNNEIIGCAEDGVQLIDYTQSLDTNRRVIINGNLIANCNDAGVGLMPDQNTSEDFSGADIIEAVRVYNNTLYGNNYGISGGDDLVAFNNIIVNSTTMGVWRVQGPAEANSVVAYTLFYNNGVDTDQSNLGAGNLFGLEPGFLHPPGAGSDGLWGTVDDDFSGLVLLSDSPALDAGVTQYIASSGEAIPPDPITGFYGTAPDLGWQEFDPFRPPTPTATITTTATPTPVGFGMVTSQINNSSDDAEEAISTGSMNTTSSDLELGADGTTDQWVGMRFNNVSIPPGGTILSAFIEFEVDDTGADPTSILLQGQVSPNALAFTSSKYDISNRPRTTASVPWNDIPAWAVINAKWQTPDLSTIVQEIVNQPDWATGNSIVIIASGTGERAAESYDGEPPAAPKLVITYTTGDTPTPTSIPNPTATPTATHTPTITPTSTPTLTSTNTEAPTPTATPTNTPTASYTPTFTPTFTASSTPIATYTATNTPTASATGTPTATNTPTNTATLTPTATPTSTPTATLAPTNTATPYQSLVDSFVSGEISVAGTVNRDYLLTQMDDGVAESITERESGGKPQNRYSFLEHKWMINVTPGNVITLYANAWSSSSSDGDTFDFAFSTDDVAYSDMFTVANTSDAGPITFVLPPSIQGTLYVRVTDSDRSIGNQSLDTIYVDHLFIRTEIVQGTPPAAPSSLSATAVSANQIDLAWDDNATDEYGYYVERSPNGINWTNIDVVGANVTAYNDMNVFPNTTYYYRVRAYNGSGDSGYSNVANVTTSDGLSLTAIGYKLKGIQTVDLSWNGGSLSAVDIYRDSNLIARATPGNAYTDDIGTKGSGSYQYQVCEANNLINCSRVVQVDF